MQVRKACRARVFWEVNPRVQIFPDLEICLCVILLLLLPLIIGNSCGVVVLGIGHFRALAFQATQILLNSHGKINLN